MTDADALAIKAYLFSLKPVHAAVPDNTLVFPFNQRWLMGVWSFLFNPDKRFEPNAARSPQWNRGAYLAEASSIAANATRRASFPVAEQPPQIRRRRAGRLARLQHHLRRDSGVGAWSDATWRNICPPVTPTGTARRGPDGRSGRQEPQLSDAGRHRSHRRPICAACRRSRPPTCRRRRRRPRLPLTRKVSLRTTIRAAKQIFEGACASCHGWTGVSPVTHYATLTGVRAVNDPTAINVAETVINGTDYMPAFGQGYSNDEIAAVANYVTARFGFPRPGSPEGTSRCCENRPQSKFNRRSSPWLLPQEPLPRISNCRSRPIRQSRSPIFAASP
jgi:mono/diheme cytochrome c family protein